MTNKRIVSPFINYENKWVALTPDNKSIVASGSTVAEVEKKLRKLNNKDAVLISVPPSDRYLTP